MNKLLHLAWLLCLAFLPTTASSFVLLSKAKATLPATPLNPEVTFVWDGSTPQIEQKEKYLDGIYAHLSDKEFMQILLQSSMDLWNNVKGSYLKLRLSTSSSSPKPDQSDKINVVVVEHSDNLSTAAFAKPIIQSGSTIIEDCDVSISDRSTSAKELAYTIAHELGHCIGLGHAHTNYGAMMGYSRMARNFSLGTDDKAGIIYLYPDPKYISGSPQELLPMCGRVSGLEANWSASGWLLFLLFLPLFHVSVNWTRNRLNEGRGV